MCVKCFRKSKRLGIPKRFSFGKVKFFAHQSANGHSIPIFNDSALNFAIEAHVYRIRQAKTKKRS